ncbi:MAG: hypothetical protein U5K69_09480 [Balneolaceae bacterium]|nr:hypothetical protein [Balneolaceae bacterium]
MSIRTLKVFLSISLVVAILQACGSSSTRPSDLKTAGNIVAIDTLINQEIDKGNIPGAVIRIQQGDSILHHKAYGFAQKYRYDMERLSFS